MKTFCLILLIAVSLTSCSSFSKTARQQRAYEKYVQKSMTARDRQRRDILKKEKGAPPPLRPTPMAPEQETAQQPLEPAPETQ